LTRWREKFDGTYYCEENIGFVTLSGMKSAGIV
jgi:hypothetical protein